MNKKFKLALAMLVLIAFATVLYYNYQQTIEMKKQLGRNIENQFSRMQITADESKMIFKDLTKCTKEKVAYYRGQLNKDKDVYQIYVINTYGIYKSYQNLDKLLSSFMYLNKDNKLQNEIIKELDSIISFTTDLKKDCASSGNYELNWYKKFSERKLN